MNEIYTIEGGCQTKKLERFRCANEAEELQELLLNNLNLLPGDQISPDKPLSWLLIKREMPVVNAGSGEIGLSLDFLLADQFGVPTLVECKRFDDNRSKKDVVAQLLEYAASGRSYWEESELLRYAVQTAGNEAKLEESIQSLRGSAITPQAFFSLLKENLNKYRIRCILFLDESPLQLRSLVEFVNAQMTEVELLIVEARRYGQSETSIVVPWVFGFSEKAREAKRASKAAVTVTSTEKTEEGFWKMAEIKLGSDPTSVIRLREFISSLPEIPGCQLVWGAGCTVKIPSVVPKSTIVNIQRDGILVLNLATWSAPDGTELTKIQRDAFDVYLSDLESLFGYPKNDLLNRMTFRDLGVERWLDKADGLRSLIEKIAGFDSKVA